MQLIDHTKNSKFEKSYFCKFMNSLSLTKLKFILCFTYKARGLLETDIQLTCPGMDLEPCRARQVGTRKVNETYDVFAEEKIMVISQSCQLA